MNEIIIFPVQHTAAICHATRFLEQHGIQIARSAGKDATHLMLPVPSFDADGRIRGGGIPEHILGDLSEDVTVIGGNLNHAVLHGYHRMDLLLDNGYLAKNAAITADCAIRVALQKLPIVLDGCPILVIGWGRIGKCLADKLKAAGAAVTVAARKATDRSILQALNYGAEDPRTIQHALASYRVIFNTVPSPVLDCRQLQHCRKDCLKIELASTPGMIGDDVIPALGLPSKLAPESSGRLIAQTILRLIANKEVS